MNYNKKIKALKKIFADDGMGGGYYIYEVVGEIKCSIAPVKKTIVEAGGREVEHNLLKVFTREKINEDFAFEYLGEQYKLCSWVDYGKVFLYEMEVL